jgi:hypothetical protein
MERGGELVGVGDGAADSQGGVTARADEVEVEDAGEQLHPRQA